MLPSPAPPRCHAIIKLGGSAITDKSSVETLRPQELKAVCESVAGLREQLATAGAPPPGIVLIHGAGSFGHPQAAAAGLSRGGSADANAAAQGFSATRASVTALNLQVVAALRQAGVPAVGLSPCGGAWITHAGSLHAPPPGLGGVEAALAAELVPVLHGDAVFDTQQRFAILSGDTLLRCLAAALRPRYAVFLTDVDGLLDGPPGRQQGTGQPQPALVPNVRVSPNGSWYVPRQHSTGHPDASTSTTPPVLTPAANDTTGGMAAKLAAAAAVAAGGVPVVIARAGSAAGAAAVMHGPAEFEAGGCSGRLRATVIRLED